MFRFGKGHFEKKLYKKGVIDSMRKATIVFAIALLFGVTSIYAATTDITVTCNRTVSVKVTTGSVITDNGASLTMAFGTLDTGVTCIASLVSGTTSFKIWNNSPTNAAAVQNYTLSITAGDQQYLRGDGTFTAAVDTYSVAAVFTKPDIASAPSASEFADNDALEYRGGAAIGADDWTATTAFSPATAGNRYATETAHPRDTGSETLNLWLAIKTPTSVSAAGAAAKSWTLTLTAE